MAKTYSVAVPISGVIHVEVEADSKEEAIDKALESEQLTLENIDEWTPHRHLVQGNVCYATQRQANATLIDDDGES